MRVPVISPTLICTDGSNDVKGGGHTAAVGEAASSETKRKIP